jgi:very-short-patch-repair endonuclease
MINCKYCNKELSPFGKAHEKFCVENPNKQSMSGSNNPNYGKKGSNQYANGAKMTDETKSKIGLSFKGKTLTEEHKAKISKSRKQYLDNNPGNIPYLLNHSSNESYPEKIFREALERRNIIGWTYNHPIKRYSLDFAFIEQKIDVEIDGGTHNLPEVILKDKLRDDTLNKLGWKTIRFTAVQIKENVEKCIDILLELL